MPHPTAIDLSTRRLMAPVSLPVAPWIIADPRIIDLDRAEWSEIPAHIAAAALANR